MKLRRRLKGSERGADVRMVQRALNRWAHPSVAIPVTSQYDQTTRDRMMAFQADQDVKPANGSFTQATLDKLWPFFDAYGRWRYGGFKSPDPTRPLPALGPVWRGGKSVLDHSCTHLTTGLDWPAFDDAFRQGEEIVAPEALEVIPNPVTGAPWSSANPGEAFYARGKSKLLYWFAHLDRNHAPGTKFRKGQYMGRVAPNAIGGGPHVHVAIDARPVLGRHLKSKRWYQFGAPPIGRQLARA